MDGEINVIRFLINSVAMLVLLCFCMAAVYKIGSMILAVLSYPVYISLYYLEMFSVKAGVDKKHIFRLNIPKSYKKKYSMNVFAALVALGLLPNAISIYLASARSMEYQQHVIHNMFAGNSDFQLLHNCMALISLLVVYAISYYTDIDDRDPLEKIDTLSIPSLWKKTLKL